MGHDSDRAGMDDGCMVPTSSTAACRRTSASSQGSGVLKIMHSEMLHPLHKTLQLMAVSISGQRLKQKAFTEKLATLSVLHGDYPHRSNIMGTLKNGTYFVENGKLIQCVLL